MVTLADIVPDRHAALLFEWRRQPEIARYMYSPGPPTWADHLRWIEGIAGDSSRRHWVIELAGQPVGSASLNEIDQRHQRAVFGMYVADERARFLGAGAAAEFLVLDEAFGPLELEKVSCEVFAANEAPIRMHLRMGFQREGILRRHVQCEGIWTDVHRFSLLRAEWAATRPALHLALRRHLAAPAPAPLS